MLPFYRPRMTDSREIINPGRDRPTSTDVTDYAARNKLGATSDSHAVELRLNERKVGTRRE